MLKKETVAESAGIVLVFVVIQRLLQVGRGAVFARVLGPSDYGVYTLAFFFIPLVATVARLGIPSCFMRYIPQYEKQGMIRDFLKKTYFSASTATVITTLICLLFTEQIARLIYDSVEYKNIIIICLLSILPYTLYECIRATFNGLRVFKLSNFVEFFHFLIFSSLAIALVIVYQSAESVFISNLIALIVVVALYGIIVLRYVAGSSSQRDNIPSKNFYKKIFRFSVWFAISPFVFSVFRYTDSWMLNRFLALKEVGLYSVAMNVAGLIFMLGTVVGSVLAPTLSKLWEEGDRQKATSALDFALRGNTMLLLGVGLLLVIFKSQVIGLLYGAEYASSVSFVGILLTFWMLNSINWIISGYAGLIEKTYIPLISNCVGLVCNVILNYNLIPKYGIMGAALATTISFFVILLVIFPWCYKEGFRLKANTLFVCLLPAIFVLNEIVIAAICVALAVIVFRSELLITRVERKQFYQQMVEVILKYKNAR